MEEALSEINEKKVKTVRFGEDIDIPTVKENDPENYLKWMGRIIKVKEMKLNKNKRNTMTVGRNKNTNPLDLKIRKIQIQEVKELKVFR